MLKKRYWHWIILFSLVLFIKVFSLVPEVVEVYYSRGVYPVIARFQRILSGWVPFSIGDIFYFVAGIYLLRSLLVFVRTIIRKEMTKPLLFAAIRKVVFVSLIVYITFNILWGINYNRVPMAVRHGLVTGDYSVPQLSHVISILTDSLNALDSAGIHDQGVLEKKKTIFAEAVESYGRIADSMPDLRYTVSSVKPSLYSYLGNYLGFTGYYNPFTGEAQVNTTIPEFSQPFVACHEIGHQLGYAKEDEANFAGFLAATASTSQSFRYSAYFDMYAYARRELYQRDSLSMKALQTRLRPRVKNDFLIMRNFYLKYQNPFEPVIRYLYAGYLKANQQPKGMMSYNAVVAMLVAYYNKQGLLQVE